jgi:hypothetical protein
MGRSVRLIYTKRNERLKKMKTMKLIKLIPVVLMGLFLSTNAGSANIHNEHFVNTEMTVNMESWMFDTNYLTCVAPTVEAWMLDECWLGEANKESAIESWMLDSGYLVDETEVVESWMLDSVYLKK